jgi:hypothetical protein
MKFRKGDKWMSRDSSLTISKRNLHKIKNQLDSEYDPSEADNMIMKRNSSLPIIKPPTNLNLFGSAKLSNKKRWSKKQRMFNTVDQQGLKVMDFSTTQGQGSHMRNKFSLDLSSTLQSMKKPNMKRKI